MTPVRLLDVYLDGVPDPVGRLAAFDSGTTAFQYADAHVGNPMAMPLSLSMPVREAPFDDVATRAFFDNLLSENDQMRRRVHDQHGIDQADFVAVLAHLGADCPGSLSCVPMGSGPVKSPGDLATDYDALQPEDLAELVRCMAHGEPLPDEFRDPSPVAGVQPKIALTRLPDGAFALPRLGAGAPTTHILKTPRLADARDPKLEFAAAALARDAGLEVAVPEIIEHDGHPSLLIARYDRTIADGVVRRVHQEDFAQAMGLPARLKYQRYGVPGRWFAADAVRELLGRTRVPAVAVRAFLKLTIFNLCVGNADNHAKNHALIYRHGPTPDLAPAYDLLPTRLNPSLRPDMGFNIGQAATAEAVTARDMALLLTTFGFSQRAAERFVSEDIVPMMLAVEAAGADRAIIPKDMDDMIGANLERVAGTLGRELPLRERDHHQAVGGAWAAS